MNVKELVGKMTLEEKASLCAGGGWWQTKPIDRLGIPSVYMTDGPHGLRKQEGTGDHLGLNASVPATCFPTAAGLASSFDRSLIARQASALAVEAQAHDVSILLGPGTNIKRSPLCGRNFEYFSEDPVLAGEMAASYIKSLQEGGVGCSLKHFAANNQESYRMGGDSLVDERTLREIYLRPFEIAVTKGKPQTVMCSYNRINGVFSCENEWLLTKVLRDDWGFDGYVVTDWGAMDIRVDALKAGCELEMPSSDMTTCNQIADAVKKGELDEAILDRAVTRMLNILYRWIETNKREVTLDLEEHHKLAREIAAQTMVLAKNNGVLPLDAKKSTAIIGAYGKKIMFQGGGSSHINNPYEDSVVDEWSKLGEVVYAEGVRADGTTDDALINEAVEAAKKAQNVLLVVGSPMETEGADRKEMTLPAGVVKLVDAVASVRPDCAVALTCGAPVELPFIDKIGALLVAYLGGQAAAGAIVDLVSGAKNPCAKFAETWPVDFRHNPSHPNYALKDVEYREGVFVGYRHYDMHGINPRFRFGYGLSYTTFEYGEPTISASAITEGDPLTVSVDVKNTGGVAGAEIVQLYVGQDVCTNVPRPVKELKDFAKVWLEPGETKTVKFELDSRAFAYWNDFAKAWTVDSGSFTVSVAPSSCPYCQKKMSVTVTSTSAKPRPLTLYSTIPELMAFPGGAELIGKMMQNAPTLSALNNDGEDMLGMDMKAMVEGIPLKTMLMFAGGAISEEQFGGILAQLNAAAGVA